MAMHLYLSLIFLNHTHGSALQAVKLSSNIISSIFCDHLRPELFRPYRALWIASMCPCNSSNSGLAIMYSYNFSFMVASSYALPISAAQTIILLSLARNVVNLKDLVETTPE